jgi:ABC-type lipoprotein release transport system permease subunit
METLTLLLPLAWRNLWRNPRRTFVTLIVVAAGLYSILCLTALLEAWAQSSRDTALNLITGSGQLHAQGYLDNPTVLRRMSVPAATLRAALDAEPVSAWAERVRVPAVVQSEYKTLPLTLVGVEPDRERKVSTIPGQMTEGHYFSSSDGPGIVLGRHLAERLKTRVGKRVIIMAQATDGTLAERSFAVVGLFAGNIQAEDQFAFSGIKTTQGMLRLGNTISEISFDVPDPRTLNDVIASLRHAAPGLDVRSWSELSPMAAAMDGFMNAFVYIWLWIMFVLVAIGIVNTQFMAVFERVREFGLLNALGMRPRLILAEVSMESAMLMALGVGMGMTASAATLYALRGGVNLGFLAQGAEFFGAGHILYPHLAPQRFIGFSLVIWALGLGVALWPAQKAATSSPVEAMSHVT